MTVVSMNHPTCSVKDCGKRAAYAVFLYDVYLFLTVDVFHEAHQTCPYICQQHLNENERAAGTVREYRGHIDYLHTKSEGQGFVIYRPVGKS